MFPTAFSSFNILDLSLINAFKKGSFLLSFMLLLVMSSSTEVAVSSLIKYFISYFSYCPSNLLYSSVIDRDFKKHTHATKAGMKRMS